MVGMEDRGWVLQHAANMLHSDAGSECNDAVHVLQ